MTLRSCPAESWASGYRFDGVFVKERGQKVREAVAGLEERIECFWREILSHIENKLVREDEKRHFGV